MSRHDGGAMHLGEVLSSASSHAETARAMLVTAAAAETLCGMVTVVGGEGGWVRPSRFSVAQARALESCLAWHPGLYRQMARTTAGVCLRFATDGAEFALAVRIDDEPRGTAAVLAPLDPGGRRPHDGISVVVDGEVRGCSMPQPFARPLPWLEDAEGISIVTAELEQRTGRGAGTMAIPGLGARHEVSVWLPCLRGCEVRELWSDGTYVEPLPARGRMLVFGDSIGQGFCAGDPLLSWPSLLAEHLGLDLVNQSVGGQVFQPSVVMGQPVADVKLVVVELGCNYRHEPCTMSAVTQDARAFLHEVGRAYPKARIVVLTPTGHDEDVWPVHEGSCARDVPAIVRVAARRLGMEVIDGTRLIERGDVTLVDGEHPGPAGHAQMAARLATLLEKA